MAELRFTILGCGSSGGVPRLGGDWGACDPENPRNRRRRCSLLVERLADNGGCTRVLVDTSPDLREQLLDADVGTLDGVVYSHAHADHMHGIDDLRPVAFNMQRRIETWADGPTRQVLMSRFGYAFVQPQNSLYPPILNLNAIDGEIRVDGGGGCMTLQPFSVGHGAIESLGFRIGGLAYLPDAATIPQATWPLLQGLDVWIVDALRRAPHPSHTHLVQTLGWIARASPRRAILTNMHVDLDYAQVSAETPLHVEPAYDGLSLTLPD